MGVEADNKLLCDVDYIRFSWDSDFVSLIYTIYRSERV
jgi:hypothetical protein